MKTPAKYIVGTSTLPFNPATFEEVKKINISPYLSVCTAETGLTFQQF